MTRRIAIKGYKLDKAGKLVPCYKHLPINIQLQKRASQRVRADKAAKPAISQPDRLPKCPGRQLFPRGRPV